MLCLSLGNINVGAQRVAALDDNGIDIEADERVRKIDKSTVETGRPLAFRRAPACLPYPSWHRGILRYHRCATFSLAHVHDQLKRHDKLTGGIALGAIDGDLEFAGLECGRATCSGSAGATTTGEGRRWQSGDRVSLAAQ